MERISTAHRTCDLILGVGDGKVGSGGGGEEVGDGKMGSGRGGGSGNYEGERWKCGKMQRKGEGGGLECEHGNVVLDVEDEKLMDRVDIVLPVV